MISLEGAVSGCGMVGLHLLEVAEHVADCVEEQFLALSGEIVLAGKVTRMTTTAEMHARTTGRLARSRVELLSLFPFHNPGGYSWAYSRFSVSAAL